MLANCNRVEWMLVHSRHRWLPDCMVLPWQLRLWKSQTKPIGNLNMLFKVGGIKRFHNLTVSRRGAEWARGCFTQESEAELLLRDVLHEVVVLFSVQL